MADDRKNPSPLVGEGGARDAEHRGRVRGRSKRSQLPHWTTERSRELRRNSTDAEQHLWRALRETFPQAKFRRQQPLGPYFADFCSHPARLIVEADGGQHAERTEHDAARTRFLRAEGYRVLRFWNNDILENTDGVLAVIAAALPLSYRERGQAAKRRGGEGVNLSPSAPAPSPSQPSAGPLPLPMGEG